MKDVPQSQRTTALFTGNPGLPQKDTSVTSRDTRRILEEQFAHPTQPKDCKDLNQQPPTLAQPKVQTRRDRDGN